MSSPSKKQHAFLRRAAAPAAALALALLLWLAGLLPALDRAWFDTLQRAFAAQAPVPENTAIVLIDEQALRALGDDPYAMRWPWPRRAFAAMFASLDRAGAEHILADFIFFERSGDSIDDQLLGSAAAGLRSVTLGAMPGKPGEEPRLPIVWPADFRHRYARLFPAEPARWGWVDVVPDSDGVIRSLRPAGSLTSVAARPGAAPQGVQLLRWRGGLEQLKERGVPVLTAAPFVTEGMRMLNSACSQIDDFEDPTSLVRAIAMQPAPAGKIFEAVRGRTVLIGVNAAGTFDAVATPVGAPEPGVLVHWTALADMRAGTFVRDAGQKVSLIALLAAALIVSLAALRKAARPKPGTSVPGAPATSPGPWRLAIAAGAVLVVLLGGSAGVFAFGGLWFAPMLPAAGALFAFGAETTAGFLRERAQRREIQGWFGAYVSPAVVDRLMREPGSITLGGERRELTVFFSDIAGFTTLSERLPSTQLVSLVNTYLQELSESVLDHGCYLDKYIGDAIMAVFGAPEPLENHALSACRAALDSQRRLEVLNEHLKRVYGARLTVRIGINTGEMIVGNVGSDKKKNYTVLGDSVNLAARLESANKEFGTRILIGPQTVQMLAGALATRPIAMLRVKGKANAVTVHELVGEHDALTDAQKEHTRACAEGFEAWCARRFQQASDAYARALEIEPDDATAARYAEASRTYVLHPPPDDWLPVLEQHSK